jgi:hypothetical protein
MKIFAPFFGGITLMFNSIKDFIKSFMLFTLGRICGIIVFLLMIDGWNYYLYTEGYSDKFTSVFTVLIKCLELFI